MELEDRIEAFRANRRALEESILPLATSLDGRLFSFQASLHELDLQAGGYVMMEAKGTTRLGQVVALRLATQNVRDVEGTDILVRHVQGDGVILEGSDRPFHDALVRAATPDEVRAWAERTARPRAHLRVGELTLAPGVPHELDAGGFDRHTFLCGQSGSGKTYSLGLILERLLADTGLRLVILDPNSDYVRLGQVREGADPALAERYREVAGGVQVHSAGPHADERLRLLLRELGTDAQGALLRLDPIADRDEYAELAALLAEEQPPTMEAMMASERPEARRLGTRIANLGLHEYGIWARGEPGSVLDALEGMARAAWWSTSARSRRARSKRWCPPRCSGGCGSGARAGSRC
jgi:hypothetical protein